MNKTIKKIIALGMGATMLAGTAAMALATDLSNYPSPFVKDGAFVGKIVIGETAASIDTVGAMDVAASLQRASSVPVSADGSGPSATASDGYKFQGNQNLILGAKLDSITSVVDNTDLPVLLASGTVEADSGTTYDYDVEVDFAGTLTTVNDEITGDIQDLGYDQPIVYFDTTPGLMYTTKVDFKKTWSPSDFVNSETINLFGKDYTFSSSNADDSDVLTLYGSQTTMLIAKGDTQTATYDGKDYTIQVIGGNSDSGGSAIVSINGDTRTVKEGDSKTIGGLPVYAKNVFVSNIGGDDVSVQLFIGSDKLELNADGTVTKNGVDLDEVTVSHDGNTANWTDTTEMVFEVTPTSAGDEVDFILPGKAYTDPLFGAFKFSFVGASDLTTGKDLLSLTRSSNKAVLTFTPRGATSSTAVTLVKAEAYDDFWNESTLTELSKDKIFIYNDGTDVDNYKTHVLQVSNIRKGADTTNTNFEVDLKDLTYGDTYVVTSTEKVINSKIGLYVYAGLTNDTISFASDAVETPADTDYTLYTNAGANATLDISNASDILAYVYEDADADKKTSTPVTLTLEGLYDATSNNNEYDFTVAPLTDMGVDDNVAYGLTDFGTYIAEETNDGGQYVKLYVPATEVSYDMFLLPVDSDVTVTSASTGGAVALNPISVGMAILDSDATLGSKPYIVIGGPCANTVAAALMGNPANCAEGFTEGKAMIKLFSDQNALLVAGFSGKDTQGACRVLANYNNPMYALSGTEVEVVTANLQSLSVRTISS